MTAQATLTIDADTKKRAGVRAKSQSMSVSAVARILLNDYATGKLDVGARMPERDENGFTPEAAAELREVWEDAKAGRNMSKPLPFKKALAELRKL